MEVSHTPADKPTPRDVWTVLQDLPAEAAKTSLRKKHMADLYREQKGMDALCKKVPLPPLYVVPLWKREFNSEIEIDHDLPKSKGGTNDRSNLQLTHWTFNRKKGDRTGDDLAAAMRDFCPA